jgi:hypothetical protein
MAPRRLRAALLACALVAACAAPPAPPHADAKPSAERPEQSSGSRSK